MESTALFVARAAADWQMWRDALGSQWPQFAGRFTEAIVPLRWPSPPLDRNVEQVVVRIHELLMEYPATREWLRALSTGAPRDFQVRFGSDGATEPVEGEVPDQVANRYPIIRDRLIELNDTIADDTPASPDSPSSEDAER